MAAWYSATARQTRALLFECDHCGCRAQAVANATGRGAAMLLAFGGDGAAREASSRAAAAASAAAARLVRRAACPSCHARRSSAMLSTAALQALHLLWLVPVLGGLGIFADVMMGDAGSHFTLAFALGALGAVAIVTFLARRKLRLADASVQFSSLTMPPRAPPPSR